MMSDDDDLLSYTPLKRQKVGCSQSVRSSQLSYSEARSRYCNKLKLSATPKQKLSSTQKVHTPSSNVSNLSRNKKKQTPPKFKKPSMLKEDKNAVNDSIFKSNCDSSLLKSSLRSSLSKIRHSNTDRLPDLEKLEEKNKNKPFDKDIANIFDDNTPDIDLMQDIQPVSSVCSDDTENSQSLLINNHEESDSIVELHTLSDREENNNDKQNSRNAKHHSNDTNDILNNSQNSSLADRGLNDDSDNDFLNIEDPVQTRIKRVNSWLENSIEQGVVTPAKVEYVRIDSTENFHKPDKADRIHEENDSPKTCVHLHFHVNTPEKLIQPTLEHFFKKSPNTNNNLPNGSVSHVNLQQTRNREDVLKAWSNIMKGNNDALPGPSKSNQVNIYKNKPATAVFSRACPFYKRVEDTNFVVDGFSYGHINGVTAYFLSHFHFDHYTGLTKKFQKLIYCSQITANLVRLKLYVEAQYIRPLPLEEPRIVDGVEVTLYDSNHCPGAVMFLFKLPTGKTMLHVGDFRAHPDMETISELWNGINVLYLDTTYLDKNYDFYSQDEVLEKCRSVARNHIQRNRQTLFVIGSYTIGKEKVFKVMASELDCKIYAPPYKEKILNCLEDQEIKDRLTRDKHAAKVHIVSMSEITPPKLKKYMDSMRSFKILVAIRPTGWEYNSSIDETLNTLVPKQIGNMYIYGLPYSEHSSFLELKRFVKFVQAEKIIPTVNVGSAKEREKMKKILDQWQGEEKKK